MLMNIRKSMKSQKGFTLVELLVVVAIIGVLAAVAIPKFTGATDEAKVAKIKADMRTIGSAIALYQAKNNGTNPTDLAILVTDKYLASEPKDPDGTSYAYAAGVASIRFNSKTYRSDGTGTGQ